MMGSTPVTLIGNTTDEPEFRYTPAGVPVATFTVASTERSLNRDTGQYEDSGTMFLRCHVWREQAEHVAECVRKGTRVVVTGTLKQRAWETKDGQKRSSFEVQAEEVAVSLRWAVMDIRKAPRRNGGPVPEDPWSRRSEVPAAAGEAAGSGGDVPSEPPF